MKGLVGFAFWAVIIVLIIFVALPYLLPDVPEPSQNFDCDDSTLYMYSHFTDKGHQVQAIAGNLDISGESFEETDHVWLLVKFGDIWVPYDWGLPRFDEQHYEGYNISYELLCKIAEADKSRQVR